MEDVFNVDNVNVLYGILLVLGINIVLVIALLIIEISNRRKINRLQDKYDRLMKNSDADNIENLIINCLEKTEMIIEKNKEMEAHLNELDRNILNCIQKVGIIRYNAFDDVGSDLSYTLAMLDGNDNGAVITSLYSRDSSITYGKPIVGGKSKYQLTAEEVKAINIAVKKHRESYYV